MNVKWISIGVVGSLFAVSHLGMIGYIASRKTESQLPRIDVPVGDYTSYAISADKDGYKISYSANDPKTAFITKDIKEKGGFLGLANETTKVTEEYFLDGKTNQGGPVSNKRSWIDQPPGLTPQQTQEIAAAPAVSSIPFVGWVAAGWIAMFGGNQGADIGGSMAEDLNENC